MTIVGTFKSDTDIMQVGVRGNDLTFFDVSSGLATVLEGIKFDYEGVIKEFPDLKDNDNWKKKAIERLKEHMKTFDTEMDKLNYIKDELVKFGNIPLYFQRHGFRVEKWK